MAGKDARQFGSEAVLEVLHQLLDEIRLGKNEEWENPTLYYYLEALTGWITDCDGYYRNNNRDMPDDGWEVICDALEAARYYE